MDKGYATVVTLGMSERPRHVVHANRSRPRDQHLRYFHRARQVAPEAIAHAAYGFEKVLVARRLQRLAQPPDVYVDRALLDIDVVAPDLVEKLGTRVDAARVRHEEAQHAELEGAQLDVAAVSHDAARCGIELETRDLDHHVGVLRRAAAHHRLDPRKQLARRERLHQVVVGARLEPGDLVGFAFAAGEKDDRYRAGALLGAHAPGERQAGRVGKHP